MPFDFKKLMCARFLFTFAVQMQAIVLGWQMYMLTKDPLFLGLIGLAEALPALGLALYAGYIVDRSRPLFVYRNVMLVSLLSALIFLLTQFFSSHLAQEIEVSCLFLSSFLTGTARAFSQPSIFSAVPRLIARDQLSRASAWMSSAMQTARILGPALGGFLFGWYGVSSAAVVVTITLVAASLVMLMIRTTIAPVQRSEAPQSIREELLSGAKFVFGHRILFPALSLDMVSVLFGGVTALLPIYAAEILFVGPKGLGILRAAPAVGAAMMSFWLASKTLQRRAGILLLSSVAGFGISILVFALSQNYWLSLIALILSGGFDSVSMIIRSAAVQLSSPDRMRGRISAVNSIFIGSSNELGEFESGIAARLLGTVPAAVFGGIVCLATVGIVTIISPALRNLHLGEILPPDEGI